MIKNITERPIILNTEMIRAITDNRDMNKTQTRRMFNKTTLKYMSAAIQMGEVSNFLEEEILNDPPYVISFCPYGQIGDRLWVRETAVPDFPKEFSYYDNTWTEVPDEYRIPEHVIYKASWTGHDLCWKPSIHMPRWACRIILEIKNIRVERLNSISDEDCWAEGIDENLWAEAEHYMIGGSPLRGGSPERCVFSALWESIYGYGSWDKNPWVWVIDFERVKDI